MNPNTKSVHPCDETNLQQQYMSSKTTANPSLPFPAANNAGNPPLVPRRTTATPYQSMFPTSQLGYGVNPYTMNQLGYGGSGYMAGYANNPMLSGGMLPADSLFSDVENVSRSAFESVGSVVQTLSSVSMMLQSTLFAVQNSVHAVVSVAEQFRHLRNSLIEQCISLVGIIKYYFRKLLRLFQADRRAGVDKIWEEAAHQSASGKDRRGIVLFFAVVIGTPYLMWSLVKSILAQADSANKTKWQDGSAEHFNAEVLYTYKAVNRDELSVTCGDVIRIAPKNKQVQVKGWILASNDKEQGLVPANYIKILGRGTVGESEGSVKLKEIHNEEEETAEQSSVDENSKNHEVK